MLKKVKLLCIIIMLSITFTLLSLSTNAENDDTLYIISETVPISAIEFAKEKFSELSYTELLYMGFYSNELNNVRLMPGFVAFELDQCDNKVYYFPIKNQNNYIAILMVIENGQEYLFQFGKSEIAKNMNNLDSLYNDPIKIAISDEAMYAVNLNNYIILENYAPDMSIIEESNTIKTDIVRKKIIDIYSNIKLIENTFTAETKSIINFQNINSDLNSIIILNDETAYPNRIIDDRLSFFANLGKMRDVAFCANKVIDDEGTCWASSLGSIINYCYKTMGTSSITALEARDAVLMIRKQDTGGYTAGIDFVKEILDLELGKELSKKGGKLTWEEVKTQILTYNSPCYTSWARDGGRHALVLCGYYYDNTDVNNADKYFMYLMDPNKTDYVKIYYNKSYTTGTRTYTWDNTLYGDYF